MRLAILGCGAVGSQVAWHVAHADHAFLLVDDDRIEDHNITTGTTIYSRQHAGMLKAVALAELLWRRAGCRCEPWVRTLETIDIVRRWQADLVVDGFDNSTARAITHSTGIPTVHVGVSEARTGEVVWDERYQVPPATFERGDDAAPCTHQLGRQILRFTASVAAGSIERFITTGENEKIDYVVTERMAVLR